MTRADFSVVKTRLKSAFFTTYSLAALCCVAGVFIVAIGDGHLVFGIPISETVAEALLLIVSLLVTFISDSLGYVHATSLRWALYREGRLEYNTNFRLFTSAKTSFANRWFMNLLSASSIILCYASTSALILRGKAGRDKDLAANAIALLCLGLALLAQVLTAAICLRHHDTRIPSWSANPLWNTMVLRQSLALAKSGSGHNVQLRFCGENIPQSRSADIGVRKRRLWHIRATKWIVFFIWALCAVSFGWSGIIIYIPTLMFNHNPFRFQWNADTTDTERSVIFGMDPQTNDPQIQIAFPAVAQFFLGILFLCFVQGLQTMGLHCMELLVNMRRDEHVWRQTGREQGASVFAPDPLIEALSSWRTVLLTIIKAVQHWLLGQAMVLHYHLREGYSEFTFNMSPSRLLVFASVTTLSAIFTTAMALCSVPGPQPTAWGHMQAMENMIDGWDDAPEGRLRWKRTGGIR